MPEVNDPKKGPEKKRFITEKIVKQPLTKGQMARRGVLFSGSYSVWRCGRGKFRHFAAMGIPSFW